MEAIETFIARYAKEFDFYRRVAQMAAQSLETTLQSAGIRCIVTYRAKSIVRLRDKCAKRAADKGAYPSADHIYEDIVDLAGVRVALYFPAERAEVDRVIRLGFNVLECKEFPGEAPSRPGKRFTGYGATHYRVRLRDEDLGESDKRYSVARVEIQVASVLMHAWSEVEHDLAYKPLAGELSEDEHAILDQLNGLVLSGEIALERLQRAGEIRVADTGRGFANHYDLASYLLGRMAPKYGDTVTDAGMGRIDLLFELISDLGIATPAALSKYLESLHGNLEQRPLAEQVIDSLIEEDPERYLRYERIRSSRAFLDESARDADIHRDIGRFMANWARLENLVRAAGEFLNVPRPMPLANAVRRLELLSKEQFPLFDYLRRFRNSLVHGVEPPDVVALAAASDRLELLVTEMHDRVTAMRAQVDRDEGEVTD